MSTLQRCMILAATCVLAFIQTGAARAADGDLQVRRISPSGTNVQPGQEAVIQFDRAMVPLGHMGRDSATLPVHIKPDPGCQWRWLDTSELACRLAGQQRFSPATRYTITVGTALKAMDGSHLAAPVTQDFTTWRPQVLWSEFRHWLSPVMPQYLLRFNMRVTAAEVARHIGFDDGHGHVVAAKVTPFTRKRQGPLWLPVPGAPGAVVEVDAPSPDTPLDAHADATQGRRVWLVKPAHALAPAQHYTLLAQPGMRSPLGPLPSKQTDLDGDTGITTYGAFAFAGIGCRDSGDRAQMQAPGDAVGSRCRPNSLNLLFSSPVPRATLAAIRWKPLPMPRDRLAAIWRDYPQWFLREPRSPTDAERPDSFPLTFKLDPMRDYAVTVPAGVKDRFGRTLAKPVTLTFQTGHRVPFINPPPSEAVLEAGQATIAPLSFTNLDRLDFNYRRLFAGDLAAGTSPAPAQDADLLKRPDLAVAPDRLVRGRLGVRKLLDGRSGVLWGTLDWSPNHPWQPYDFMGEVTPYQVLAKVGHFDTLVWVSRLDTGAPVAGMRVGMYVGQDNALDPLALVAGKPVSTDAHGVAVLPGAATLPTSWFEPWKTHKHFYIGATRADTLALLPLDWSFKRSVGDASHYAFSASNAPAHGHMRVWAVTEQGIYKPDSDVRFIAFVRDEGRATLVAPPALDYTLQITDPTGNTVLEKKHVKLSDFGGMDGQLHIPATATTGSYSISLSWPTATGTISQQAGQFMVTDFVPATFQVRALLQGTRFGPGEKVDVRATAALHAGGPYTDAKVRFTTQLIPRAFAPDTPVAAGFDFNDDEATYVGPTTVAQTEGMLGHDGAAATQVVLPKDSPVLYGDIAVEAAVESARATWVANSAHAVYAARDRFVGVRTSDWMQIAGKPFDVQYLVVDAAGQPQAGSPVQIELQRQVISSVRVKNGAGDFTPDQKVDWKTEAECKASSGKAPAKCALTAKQAGSYRIVAHVTDTRGRVQRSTLSTWVTGAGGVVWPQGKGVTLVPDKSSYHVGDIAHVLVQNPYPGARALITVERYGVLWKKLVTLKGGAPVIDVPIGADCFPGAYLSVAIFSPRVSPPADPDLGRPELALGYMALKVSGKGSALKVDVKPAAAQYKPRQTVQVDVDVHGQDGHAPGSTRLVAIVVDQSVVDLLQQGAKYYDPLARFYAPPDGPDVTNFSLAEQLLTQLQPKAGKGESPGGGGGESAGPNVRSNFSYATYWNDKLTTDAAGHAHFSFTVPDNLTRWRILVIAMRPGAEMGLGDGSVQVNLPLQIQPALPNQMHVGDQFGAAFNVTNRTSKTLHVHTRIEASGPIEGGKAAATDALKLGAFGHGLRWLQLAATAPGSITLTASAQAGKLGDAVRAQIPVTIAGTEVVAAEYGSTLGASAQVPVKVPAQALPGTSKVEVKLAPTLVGGLDGAFAVLRDDLLRTWEIRLSRGVLASDYLRLKPVLGDTVTWPHAAKDIDATLAAAADFQAPDGGMAFWIPRDHFVSPYLSVYTALAFDWFEEAGHPVPASVREHLQGYLQQKILAKGANPDDVAAPVLRAGAMAALAPSGKLPAGAVAGMLPELPKLRLFGQALLLDAALGTHDHASAQVIVKSLLSHAEESAGEISFNEDEPGIYLDLLGTPLRSNCAVLDALSRYKTEIGDQGLLGTTPQKLMRWVASRRRNAGGWPNSQENVFCTSAIVHYADAYEPPVHDLSAQVQWPGKAPATATFAARSTPGTSISAPAAAPGQNFNVDVTHGGQGRLYYNVLVSYAMAPDALPPADAGFTLKRSYAVQRGRDWVPVGPASVLKRGDIVRVALDVDAPTERHHVVVTDPLPGAFEAVNRQLATAAQTTPSAQPGLSVLMFDSGPWPNMSIVDGGFYHRETAFDAVRFYADDLPPGHYRLVYSAQVIAPGRFIAPAPQVKEIYQPDVFGRGAPQHLRVILPEN
ncbi:MG2 domain-containing protein [Rhodanobacter sp. 115]|uniref:alpha-2-macroglobulin family protein n=1 Tax=Rhodanobacter sp. FW021-MT20 TaxID=1162282 RepID=UPI0034E59D64